MLETKIPQRPMLFVAAFASVASALSAQIPPPALLRDLGMQPHVEAAESSPGSYVVAGGRLWFVAEDLETGDGLFVSDGTVAGTRSVAGLVPEPDDYVRSLVSFRGRPFFSFHGVGRSGLWTLDPVTLAATQVAVVGAALGGEPPRGLAVAGNRLFFTAADPATGDELWVSDGTAAGTRMVVDLVPGSDTSHPSRLQSVGNRVLFRVAAGRSEWALQGSDGTAAGTEQLIGPFSRHDGLTLFDTELGGLMPFKVRDVLYVTDGTAAGTRMLRAGLPGNDWQVSPVVYRGALFFALGDSGRPTEIWRTDGTATGTERIFDGGNTLVHPLGVSGSQLLFSADGRVFSSDGSVGGHSEIGSLQGHDGFRGVVVGSRLVFSAWNAAREAALFATDGQRVWLLKDSVNIRTIAPEAFAGRAWFTIDAGDGSGYEPWTTDGTARGTRRFADLGKWPAGATTSSDPRNVVVVGSDIALLAESSDGERIWRSDGTAPGTRPGPRLPGTEHVPVDGGALVGRAGTLFLRSHPPGHPRVQAELYADRGDGLMSLGEMDGSLWWSHQLFIPHRDGIATFSNAEVVTSDGTAAGTVRLTPDPVVRRGDPGWGVSAGADLIVSREGRRDSIFRIRDGVVASSVDVTGEFLDVVAADGFVFMNASIGVESDDITDYRAWVTDGTRAGTFPLDEPPGPVLGWYCKPLCTVPGGLIFMPEYSPDPRLWFTDGTRAGTRRLPDVFEGGSYPTWATYYGRGHAEMLGDRLVVTVEHPEFGIELKVLNSSGVHWLDINPGPGSSMPHCFERVGNELWFVASGPSAGLSLYRTDGTVAGTLPVMPLRSDPKDVALRNGRVWIDLFDGVHGRELWSIDPGAVTEQVGHACGAGLELPRVDASDPLLGSRWTIRGQGGAAGQPGFLAIGLRSAMPRRVAGWCWTDLDLDAATVVGTIADSSVPWAWYADLPNDPALRGVQLIVQSWHAEPGGPSGLASSPSVLAVFGSW